MDCKPDYTEIMESFAAYVAKERPRLDTPSRVADLMRPLLRDQGREEMHVLLLDAKHGLLSADCVTIGLVDRSQIHPREVFRRAIRENCSSIILVHNHPSGDPTPSAQDISSTNDLVAAGKVVGITVVDHVVLGSRTESRPKDYLSFREENLF